MRVYGRHGRALQVQARGGCRALSVLTRKSRTSRSTLIALKFVAVEFEALQLSDDVVGSHISVEFGRRFSNGWAGHGRSLAWSGLRPVIMIFATASFGLELAREH
jgi:hypothetical protein